MTDITEVTVRPLREIGLASFVDLTGVAALSIVAEPGRMVTITFPGILTAEQCAAVCDRAASMDDADQADRANVAALAAELEATAPTDALTLLVIALAHRSLNIPAPAPVLPPHPTGSVGTSWLSRRCA